MFRCRREPLQSIRKRLLSELNLQSEPQLPAGGLDLVRKHWRRTFNNIARNAEDPAGNSNPQIPHFLHIEKHPKHAHLWPYPSSSGGRRRHCVTWGWKQHRPEVLSSGLWGLHDRYAVVFVRIHVSLHIQKHGNPFFLSVRPWMGQLGDPPSEPHHPHLRPLRPTRKCRPVSIIPVQHPGRQLTGRIPAKIKQIGSYVTHYM